MFAILTTVITLLLPLLTGVKADAFSSAFGGPCKPPYNGTFTIVNSITASSGTASVNSAFIDISNPTWQGKAELVNTGVSGPLLYSSDGYITTFDETCDALYLDMASISQETNIETGATQKYWRSVWRSQQAATWTQVPSGSNTVLQANIVSPGPIITTFLACTALGSSWDLIVLNTTDKAPAQYESCASDVQLSLQTKATLPYPSS